MSPIRARALCFGMLAAAAPAWAAEPYVDRVLDEEPQVLAPGDTERANAQGWARTLRVETTLGHESGQLRSGSRALSLYGTLDTPQHGALSLSATGGEGWSEGGLRQRVRYWRADQLGLPLDGGWLANHSVGNVPGLQVSLARGFGRVGLPSSPILGLAGDWRHDPLQQVTLAAGQPSVYSSTGLSNWSTAGGRLFFGGAQVPLGAATVAVQAAAADDVRDPFSTGGQGISSRGLWGAWNWQGMGPWASDAPQRPRVGGLRPGALQVQANVLRTRSEVAGGPGTEAIGTWVDARWRTDMDHAAGLLYLQPGLRWGSYLATSDLRGAYWHGEYGARQWYVTAAAEWTDSVSRVYPAAGYGSASVRYRMDLRRALVLAAAARAGAAPGTSERIGLEQTTEWGQTQWQLDGLQARGRSAARAGVDHAFALSASDSTLSASLAFERSRESGRRTRAVLWGVLATLRPWSGVTVDANLRGSEGNESRVLNASVGTSWWLNRNWSLLAQWSQTRGQDLRPLSVLSPITEASERALPSVYGQRRVQLTLRYQDTAGTASIPLGGSAGEGAGALEGQVYFDENANGRREASEAGAPDIEIRLDGRYTVRTDAQGRYSFPLVAAGVHRVELVKDNVPLPWNPPFEEAQRVEVRVRGEGRMDFGLRRQ